MDGKQEQGSEPLMTKFTITHTLDLRQVPKPESFQDRDWLSWAMQGGNDKLEIVTDDTGGTFCIRGSDTSSDTERRLSKISNMPVEVRQKALAKLAETRLEGAIEPIRKSRAFLERLPVDLQEAVRIQFFNPDSLTLEQRNLIQSNPTAIADARLAIEEAQLAAIYAKFAPPTAN